MNLPASIPRDEWAACAQYPGYFIDRFCFVYDGARREWVPFRLWAAQWPALDLIDREQLACILKARQLGMSWLVLAYILWSMIFHPAATCLIFSKREEEALYLLGEERLRGMYRRLPEWMRRAAPAGERDGARAWGLANGSIARAFPSNAGDSYTATVALVDEADLVPDLDNLLGRVKPTIDAGGKLILISRVDKSKPESAFKRIYRASKNPEASPWRGLFLPWQAHPGRDRQWYARQQADILTRTGSLDDLHEQYPETDAQALAPRTLDKRLAPAWLQACYAERAPLNDPNGEFPAIPGLSVYAHPARGRRYVIGADPAEGNPQSDESAAEVLDADTGEQVATLAGRFEPSTFAAYLDQLGEWYNAAPILCERNNHGHAVLLWLRDHSGLKRLCGPDDKEGWHSTSLGKARLYDLCADAVRAAEVLIHALGTYLQLASIEGSTLRAPAGQHDDKADGFALACAARVQARRGTGPIGFDPEAGLVARLPQW